MLITLEKHKIWKKSDMKHMEEYKCLPKVEVMRKKCCRWLHLHRTNTCT